MIPTASGSGRDDETGRGGPGEGDAVDTAAAAALVGAHGADGRGLVTLGETMALVSAPPGARLHHTPPLDLRIGGAESNVAIGIRRLGHPATWIGRTGTDSLGHLVTREIRAEGVTTHTVTDPHHPTGLMVKERWLPDRATVTYYRHHSAGSHLQPHDIPEHHIAAAAILHLTGITPGLSDTAAATVRHAIALARTHHVPISFDVNHRTGVWRDRDPGPTYREIATHASILFAGLDEALHLTGPIGPTELDVDPATDPGAVLDALAEHTPGTVVLKLGAQGCLARAPQRGADEPTVVAMPARPVRVVDTVGAGDAFVAGYLAAHLDGHDLHHRLHRAVTTGAFACLSPGDWEGYPHRHELDTLETNEPVTR